MKIFFLLSFFSLSSYSLETDQFLAQNANIKDSGAVLDRYFNLQIEKAINEANTSSKNKSCRDISNLVMDNLVGGKYFAISAISRFATKSKEIERFPDDSVSNKEYVKMSFYENSDILLKVVDFARTINVYGVHMGTDKLGHFALVGRNYFHNYQSNLKDGQEKDEAIKNAILKGYKTEKGLLGYLSAGVLSYGDMEANYQGMKFAIDLCEGENPMIIKEDDYFIKNPNNIFKMNKYFNPKMDESFNFSFWRPGQYARIKEKLEKSYCESRKNPIYLERTKNYPNLVSFNINDQLIREYIWTIPKFNPKLEDFTKFCQNE